MHAGVIRCADRYNAVRRGPRIAYRGAGVEACHIHDVGGGHTAAAVKDGSAEMSRILEDQFAGSGKNHVIRVRMIELQGRSRIDLERPFAEMHGA